MELSDFLKMQHDLAVEKGWIWDRSADTNVTSAPRIRAILASA